MIVWRITVRGGLALVNHGRYGSPMEQDQPVAPTAVVAGRVRELRAVRRWSAQRLADEMTKIGIEWNRGVVAKLETGRRESLSVAELFGLAYALEVNPLVLLLPQQNVEYDIAPNVRFKAVEVYGWLMGDGLPPFESHRELSDEEKAVQRLDAHAKLLASLSYTTAETADQRRRWEADFKSAADYLDEVVKSAHELVEEMKRETDDGRFQQKVLEVMRKRSQEMTAEVKRALEGEDDAFRDKVVALMERLERADGAREADPGEVTLDG